jgi:RND family efflux transporter MFP subunit
MFNNIWLKIKPWLRGWKLVIVITVLLAAFITNGIIKSKNDTSHILTESIKKQDLKQTVLATGVVTSSTDLNLSFKASGNVRQVNTAVGRKVSAGAILATLDQKDQAAQYTSARGSLAAAQANYDRILAGASSEDVAIAQVAVNSAQTNLNNTIAQQAVLVNNARSTMLNAGLSAASQLGNTSTGTIAISGTYTGTQEGEYVISLYQTGNGLYYNLTGLESGSGPTNRGVPVALGTRGLYMTFSSTGEFSTSGNWVVAIPNVQSSTYLSASNAYLSAVQTQSSAISTAQSSLDSAIATLNLKKAEARPADLAAARAQILSAQGQVQAANAALENTIIRAAASGTVTKVDIKVGQPVSAFTPVIVVQNVDQLYLEANISEANITQIQQGQKVQVTFDALSADQIFEAVVANVDLSSTVVSGVVNYKVTATLLETDLVKPGMTANMTILTDEKSAVLAVPQRSIILRDGKKYIRIITNSETKTFNEKEITTGLSADGGLVEVISGLEENQVIVTFIEKK